jgi:CheY-like chemotaxis protein
MSEGIELILLVDDEDIHLNMFENAIKLNNTDGKYAIQKARTVSEALKYVNHAAIIVLDANFPNDLD